MGSWSGLMGWVWDGMVGAQRCFVAITTILQDITISLVLQLP
jgi:hypothetical protein